jgi:hypothetical protein
MMAWRLAQIESPAPPSFLVFEKLSLQFRGDWVIFMAGWMGS